MAEYNPSKIIKDGNTYNFRDTTKIPLAGSNAISGSLIPSTDGTVNLGSSTNKWKSIYSDSYYYGTTAWGLDKQNEWTNFQRMTSNPAVWYLRNNTVTLGTTPSSNRYIGMFFEDVNGADLGYVSFQANKNSYNSIMFSLRNYDGTNVYTGALRYRASTTGAYCFFPETSECDLGISTNKWKTLNGINPGALSLPSISSTGANAWIAIDTTNWVASLATSNAQKYMPPADGWLNVRVDNAVALGLALTDGGNYMHQMVRSETPSSLALLLPVFKDKEVAILVAGNENLAYDRATFYPCQGNV